MNLGKDLGYQHVQAAIAAADDTDTDSAAIDTSGYDGVILITSITDSVDTGVATLTAKQCDTSGGTYAALTGAAATATSGANDDLNGQLLIVDVFRPLERYVKANLGSATANIAYGETLAILYNSTHKPIAQTSTEVADLAAVAGPAEA